MKMPKIHFDEVFLHGNYTKCGIGPENDKITSVVLTCDWPDVTCKNCLKHRPKKRQIMPDFKCDTCGDEKQETLYQGYFHSPDWKNPFAKGTVSSGTIQLLTVCAFCLDKAIKSGHALAGELYE